MADAMKGVTKAMIRMNKQISLPGLQKIMNEFMKENERAEINQEMIGDTIDDAMGEEANAAEEDALYNQVLDELGIEQSNLIPNAPANEVANESSASQAQGIIFSY